MTNVERLAVYNVIDMWVMIYAASCVALIYIGAVAAFMVMRFAGLCRKKGVSKPLSLMLIELVLIGSFAAMVAMHAAHGSKWITFNDMRRSPSRAP